MSEAPHYDALASRYEQAYFYEPGAYTDWLLDVVIEALAPAPSHRLADLGCGTGAFTEALAHAAGLAAPVLALDESAASIAIASRRPGLDARVTSLAAFAEDPRQGVDRILLKEVVHHLDPRVRDGVLSGLAARLAPGGRLLIVTRPLEPAYPFFEAARAEWRRTQDAPETYARPLAAAGLAVAVATRGWPVVIGRERWFSMIRGRFWSTFAAFSDEQVEQGLRELATTLGNAPELRFEDQLVLITASR